MPQATGTIKSMRKDRKGLQLGDGKWYSSFNPLPEGIEQGVCVTINFKENGNFNNIQGSVQVSGGSPAPAATSSAPQADTTLPTHYEKLNYASLVKTFPVAPDHPDRAIIRQNSLTNAVRYVTALMAANGGTFDPLAVKEDILKYASEFEKYSTGDLEVEAADRLALESTSE